MTWGAREIWCALWMCQCPSEEASEVFCTTSLPSRDVAILGMLHMLHQHLLPLSCHALPPPSQRQPSHRDLPGKHLFSMQPGQASLSSCTSCLQRLLSLDFVILICWASFQCQQKSIPSSGRSHQSIGNELCKKLCHRHTLSGNRGTLFPQLTWCDPLALCNVNILLRAWRRVPLPTLRELWGSLLYILWNLHGAGPDVNVWIRELLQNSWLFTWFFSCSTKAQTRTFGRMILVFLSSVIWYYRMDVEGGQWLASLPNCRETPYHTIYLLHIH